MPPIPNRKHRGLFKKLSRLFRYHSFRLLRIDEPPHIIARGLAIGFFIGLLPIIGFHMAIGTAIAIILRQSIIPFILMVWVTNPVTLVPIYAFNYQIGKFFFPHKALPDFHLNWPIDWSVMFGMGKDVLYTLLAGSAVVGVIASIIIYFVSIPIITFLREQNKQRRKIRIMKTRETKIP